MPRRTHGTTPPTTNHQKEHHMQVEGITWHAVTLAPEAWRPRSSS
ncbi:MAG TPA: hypothetical protein VEG38_07350 [Acidimicrobiia bacterium]|nr:hypothetical protein [Acidimicrobiia bacterium]